MRSLRFWSDTNLDLFVAELEVAGADHAVDRRLRTVAVDGEDRWLDLARDLGGEEA